LLSVDGLQFSPRTNQLHPREIAFPLSKRRHFHLSSHLFFMQPTMKNNFFVFFFLLYNNTVYRKNTISINTKRFSLSFDRNKIKFANARRTRYDFCFRYLFIGYILFQSINTLYTLIVGLEMGTPTNTYIILNTNIISIIECSTKKKIF